MPGANRADGGSLAAGETRMVEDVRRHGVQPDIVDPAMRGSHLGQGIAVQPVADVEQPRVLTLAVVLREEPPVTAWSISVKNHSTPTTNPRAAAFST
jgi:hypothetical protein